MSSEMYQLDDEFLESFNCLICLQIPEGDIYQCINGHSTCENCCADAEICAQCRTSYDQGKIRNRSMETVVGLLKTECPYAEEGCKETIRRRDLEAHKINCIYNGNCIQFCRILGMDCDYWSNNAIPDDVFAHLIQEHDFVKGHGFEKEILVEGMLGLKSEKKPKTPQDSLWTTVLQEFKYEKRDEETDALEGEFKKHFVIITKLNAEDNTISWLCVHVGEDTDEIEVEFTVESQSYKVSPLQWTVQPIPILEAAEILPIAPYRFPVALLTKHYTCQDSGNLELNFSVEKVSDEFDITSVTLPEIFEGEPGPISVFNPKITN